MKIPPIFKCPHCEAHEIMCYMGKVISRVCDECKNLGLS